MSSFTPQWCLDRGLEGQGEEDLGDAGREGGEVDYGDAVCFFIYLFVGRWGEGKEGEERGRFGAALCHDGRRGEVGAREGVRADRRMKAVAGSSAAATGGAGRSLVALAR